jgi:hypothetical protein
MPGNHTGRGGSGSSLRRPGAPIGLAAILALAAVVWLVWPATETWTATIYRDTSLAVHAHVEAFASLEECRDGAVAALQARGWDRTGTFECGLNCEPWGDPSLDMLLCEETRD